MSAFKNKFHFSEDNILNLESEDEDCENNSRVKAQKTPCVHKQGYQNIFASDWQSISVGLLGRWHLHFSAALTYTRDTYVHMRPRPCEECYLNHTICHFSGFINSLAQKKVDLNQVDSRRSQREVLVLFFMQQQYQHFLHLGISANYS